LERKAPPTFDIVVEIQEREQVTVHPSVGEAVDAILHAKAQKTEMRWVDEDGEIRKSIAETPLTGNHKQPEPQVEKPRIYLFGVNQSKLEEVAREKGIPLRLAYNLKDANLLLTTKNYYRRKPQKIRDAENAGIPIYAIKSSNVPQLRQCLENIYIAQRDLTVNSAMEEVEKAVNQVKEGSGPIELNPQNAFIRRLQHILAKRLDLNSQSHGKEPGRRVVVSRRQGII